MSESKGIWIWTSLSRPVFAVRNDSDQPIYQVRILGQAIEIAMVHAGSVRHATMMPEQAERFQFVQKCTGGILSPFESYLLLRGVKTLAVRMKQHDANGRVVAEFLEGHREVKRVFYPGLTSHPQHELAKRQQRGFGSMISIELGSLERANAFAKRLRLGFLAESLGGVETLVCHPATMTHAAVGAEERARLGITDGLMRISVGIEDVEDIVGDLEQALEQVG